MFLKSHQEVKKYDQNTPKQGDIVFVDAEPHLGKEYGGHNFNNGNIRRPLIVLSNDDYNEATGMVIGMFVTSSDNFMNEMLKPFADFESCLLYTSPSPRDA